ncbi:MAG: GDP-mannose 4,6-dehydratase, partial [Pirellulales bacterium]
MYTSILVTGGAGFIGSHLIERLLRERDEPIVCLDNFNDFYDPAIKRSNVAAFAENARVTLLEGDFCDAQAMQALFTDRSISSVIHLGAYAGVRPSVANPLVYERVNV